MMVEYYFSLHLNDLLSLSDFIWFGYELKNLAPVYLGFYKKTVNCVK